MADTTIGVRLTADDGISPKVKSIKQELREAQALVVQLTDKFGATSKEVAGVAQYAAQLKDKMQDATKLIDAFNPDTKFKAFGASIQTVVGGFTALTGAMGLLGVESEEVQKTLLKVQSALAISQGVAQLQEGIQSFKNLGAVILNTLGKSGIIGIAIAGVGALALAFSGLFKKNRDLIDAQKEYNKALGNATLEVNKVKVAFEQAKKGLISKDEALKQYNDTIGKTVGHAKDLEEAEQLTRDNARAYIQSQALKAKANFLLQKSIELSTNAELARMQIEQDKLLPFQRKIAEQKLKQDEANAEKYLKMAEDLAAKTDAVSSGFDRFGAIGGAIGGGGKGKGGGKATTPKGKMAEKETKEVLSALDDRIQNQLDREKLLQQNSLNIRRMFLLEQQTADEAALKLEQDEEEKAYDAHVDLVGRQAAIDAAATQAKIENMQAVAGALSALSELFGTQTAAGKVLAIASATINTYLGATKALAQGGIAGIAGAVAVIAAGLASVKKIISVKVPKEQGSASVGLSAAPLALQRPVNSSTTLDQQSLNAIGNATVRAYVTEVDITSNVERVRRLNRQARLG